MSDSRDTSPPSPMPLSIWDEAQLNAALMGMDARDSHVYYEPETEEIAIDDIDRAEFLAALFNKARPFGLGFLHASGDDMTVSEARQLLAADDNEAGESCFDYLKGRLMKVLIGQKSANIELYDRTYGTGAARMIADGLRRTDR